MRSFFIELKRRNVLRAGALYIGAAWALSQGLAQLLPVFDIPNSVTRWFVIALIIGFPFAMLFSWFYEWTPQGLQRENDVGQDESIARDTGKKLDRWIIAVLSLAVVLLLANTFGLHKDAAPAPTGQNTNSTAAPLPGLAERSIAVLPFENLSDDKANAYFAEGIQDEILTRLAKLSALKVISRTSTQQYSAKPGNLLEIAKQLGVANILEGTVQKSGESVHINVQLIRAASDEHLWAESYNRKLDDVFGVEGEVAQAVADVLKAKLTGAEVAQLAARLTQNPAAYDAYLRGLSLIDRTSAWAENATQAITAFEQAVKLDPELAPAWARLSYTHSRFYFVWEASSAHRDAAQRAAEVASRLAPAATETLIAQGFYRYWVEDDYAGARAIFERIRGELPNGSEPILALAGIARRQGRWRESQELAAEAVALDPRNPRPVLDAGQTALAMRDFATAQGLADRALAIAPADAGVTALQVELLQMQGKVEQAQRVIDQATIPAGDVIFLYAVTNNATLVRRYATALTAIDAELARADRRLSDDGYLLFLRGELQRHAGDSEAARDSYQQARTNLAAQAQSVPGNYWLPPTLAQVEAGLGNKAAALEQARRAIALLPSSTDAYFGPNFEEVQARVQARFGQTDEAITALQRLAAMPYGLWPVTAQTLRLDPDWDTLRADPRFQKLLQLSGK